MQGTTGRDLITTEPDPIEAQGGPVSGRSVTQVKNGAVTIGARVVLDGKRHIRGKRLSFNTGARLVGNVASLYERNIIRCALQTTGKRAVDSAIGGLPKNEACAKKQREKNDGAHKHELHSCTSRAGTTLLSLQEACSIQE